MAPPRLRRSYTNQPRARIKDEARLTRLAIFASRSKRILCERLESLVRVLPPVPGYVDFSRFSGPKIPGYFSHMRGLSVSKYLIQKRYLRRARRLLRPIRRRPPTLTLSREQPASGGGQGGQVSRLEKRTVVARAR